MLLEHDINQLFQKTDLGLYEINTPQHPYYINSFPTSVSPAMPSSTIPGPNIQNVSTDYNFHIQYAIPQTSSSTESSTVSTPPELNFQRLMDM